mgnify:CR=1 FL=1
MSVVLQTTPGTRTDLYVSPIIKQFGQRDSENLFGILRNLDGITSVNPVVTAEELKLQPDGQTVYDECRFTGPAFNQAAQLLAPGLSKFLPDMAGTTILPDDRASLVDAGMAVNLWNEMVDLRFALFSRHRIIRNEETKRIEGLVGHKHQFLENLALYQNAVETLATYHPECHMYAAQLIGRRFSIWFRASEPMFQLAVDGKDWPFYYGYYFTNGEATGTAVRGTMAVFTPKGVCLASYRRHGQRVNHTGKEFFQRLVQMFTAVCSAEIPHDKIREGAEALLQNSLGYTMKDVRTTRNSRHKKLVHALSLLGVTKNLATEVVDVGLTEGRLQGTVVSPTQEVNRLYSSRTLLDLFVPLLRIARKIDIARREKIEQAAFELLMGRFLL